MKLTGHKTRSVFERYNVVSGDDLREAAQKLNAAMQNGRLSERLSVGQSSDPTTTAQSA